MVPGRERARHRRRAVLVADWDDVWDGHHKLDRFHELKQINPKFKATLFAVPGRCTRGFLEQVPDWLELAVHGWLHPDPYECLHWPKERLLEVMDHPLVKTYFVQGFKAPGWQISAGCYEAIAERGWWLADQRYNDGRRPVQIRVHCEGDGGDCRRDGVGDHWHGHIQDVCDNGLEETWDRVVERIKGEEEFRFVSEAVRLEPRQP